MSRTAHTPDERAHLLAAVGAPVEAIEAEREPAPEAEKPKRTRKDKAQTPTHEGLEHDVQAIVQSIVTRAGADKDMALTLSDDFAQGVFDSNKVSKLEAAARGIDPSAHNKSLWTAVQNLRSALKKGVRDHYTATIAAKVRKTSAVADDKRQQVIEAFMASDAFVNALEVFEKGGE